MFLHGRKKFTANLNARNSPDYRINSAAGAQSRITIIDPVFDIFVVEDVKAIKAAASLAIPELATMPNGMLVGFFYIR